MEGFWAVAGGILATDLDSGTLLPMKLLVNVSKKSYSFGVLEPLDLVVSPSVSFLKKFPIIFTFN